MMHDWQNAFQEWKLHKWDFWVPCSLRTKYKLNDFGPNYFVIIMLLLNLGEEWWDLMQGSRLGLFRVVQLLFSLSVPTHDVLVLLQIDEDPSLVPEAIQGGTFGFNSSANVPAEGFQF